MNHLDFEEQKRLNIGRWRRKLKRRRKGESRRRKMHEAQERQLARDRAAHAGVDFELSAPRFFGMWQDRTHNSMTSFLRRLRRAVLVEDKRVCICFKQTTKLYSDGVLLFYAEVNRIVSRKPRSIICTESRVKLVNEVLQHLGLFQLMGRTIKLKPQHPNAVNWQAAQGVRADLEGIGPVLEQFAGDTLSRPLFIGLQEAVTNVPNHAYLKPRADGTGLANESGWWMFFRHEKSKGELQVAICDLGLGIPATLDLQMTATILQQVLVKLRLTKHHDGSLIQAAVESQRTRTDQAWRGRGLGQMRKVIDQIGGILYIFSNSGGYRFGKISERTSVEESKPFRDSIFGTLICWTVPLSETG